MDNYDQLLRSVSRLPVRSLIGISGFGGSGKSTLAARLSVEIDSPIVSVDSFFEDSSAFSCWEAIDYERLVREVLVPYKNGSGTVSYHHFDWESNSSSKVRSTGRGVHLIVEGVGLFRPRLIEYFDYTIWIDCSLTVATERGKTRDKNEYNSDNDVLWDGLWRRNDQEFFDRFGPHTKVDFRFRGGTP